MTVAEIGKRCRNAIEFGLARLEKTSNNCAVHCQVFWDLVC